ncbi:acyltransferase [Aquabacterium sp.]|uniref:acyltransferase family protein n=1 Tax=Aquabacterium sp. TaxID=1872578 RepID=UPI002486E04B|nr:acyltransferase [Aquabacterium sp.]MDI1260905.1 acyltransferase [Aquabacterium sp.]
MRRFGGLEGLRAWLAWAVVFSHLMSFTGFSQMAPWLAKPLGQLADCAVMVFTILSGFVITHLLVERREPYARYIVRRFLRIYPVYAVALLAGIGGTYLAFDTFLSHPWGEMTPATQRMLLQSESLASGDFLWHLAAHLSMLHGAISSQVLYESQYMFLGPAWSLSLEWQFYLVAPLMVALAMHRLGQFALTAAAIWAYVLYTRGVFGEFMLPSVLPGAGLYFGVGMATRFLLKANASLSAFPLALLMLGAGLLMNATGTTPILVWAAFVCMMLLNDSASDPVSQGARWTFAQVFSSPVSRWLGDRSYATYLIHMPIVQLVTWVCVTQFGMGLAPTAATVVLVVVPSTLVASALLHRYVELPAIHWGRRPNRQAPMADRAAY